MVLIALQKMFRAPLRRDRNQRFTVTSHQGGDGLWRLGEVQQCFVTAICKSVNSGKYLRCVASFLTFFHRYSIGLKSGEYAGSWTFVKRVACAAKNCPIALLV